MARARAPWRGEIKTIRPMLAMLEDVLTALAATTGEAPSSRVSAGFVLCN